jgi:hypothetical protein
MSIDMGPLKSPLRAVWKCASATACAWVMVGAAHAQETERVPQLHGYGTAAYGNTDGNAYAVGDAEGDYDHGELSLVALAQPIDRLSIATNVSLEQTPGGFEPNVDYAFGEWSFSDRFRFRAGRVKQPFGLYTEIFDVGTARPFVTLPQGIYGPSGFVAEGFDGLAATGRLGAGRAWALDYDVYGGSIAFADTARLEEQASLAGAERIGDVIGGRLVVETPLPGLAGGVSAYTGTEDAGRHSAFGVHAEYLAGRWSLRAEVARRTEDGGSRMNALYAEAARRIARWQIALRHDRGTDSGATGAAGRHRDTAVGLGYWFAPGFVLKTSYHRVEGNLFAGAPGAEGTADQAIVRDRTHMVVVGAQFSF